MGCGMSKDGKAADSGEAARPAPSNTTAASAGNNSSAAAPAASNNPPASSRAPAVAKATRDQNNPIVYFDMTVGGT